MRSPPSPVPLRHQAGALALLGLLVMADGALVANAQISSYSTSETRVENAPLQVQATFDNSRQVSITASGVVGLRSPWAGTTIEMGSHGGSNHNFYNPSGAIQADLGGTSGSCLNAAALSATCAEAMPILRYDAGVPTLADYYAIANPNSSFNLSIITVNPDQPSSLRMVSVPEGTVLIPNAQAGASRYEVTVPGGTGMVVNQDNEGGLTLDASRATSGASGRLTMVSVTSSPELTAISQSTADVRLDAPTAVAEANRVNFVRAAGSNVNAVGRGCTVDANGVPSGSGCTLGVVATTERFQVWDPVKAQPVQLVRPRLMDADYVKADPNQRTTSTSMNSLKADTNQTFATSCNGTTGHCRYVVETYKDGSGQSHSAVVPINSLPIANSGLTTILLPSYSTQIFSAGGVAGAGLGAVLRSASGAGNSMQNNGIGATTSLETTTTVIINQ
jgi:hypothetical protein